MRWKLTILIVGIFLFLLSVNQSHAGLRISLKDGTSVRGELVRRTSQEMVIRTGGVSRTFEMKNIRAIEYEHLSSDSFNSVFGSKPTSELSEESTRLLLQSRGYLPASASGEISVGSAESKASVVRPEDFTAELRILSDRNRPKGYYSFYEGHDNEKPAKSILDQEPKQLIHLKSGRTLEGLIVGETDQNLIIKLTRGTMTILKSDVKVIETESLIPQAESEMIADATSMP